MIGRRQAGAAAALLIALPLAPACSDSSPTENRPQEAVFLVRSSAATDETFHVLLRDPEVIAEAQALVGQGNRRVVSGEVRRGDGSFNSPWSWHLAPETVHFADATTEVCDGRPSDVEGDLDYWVEVVGQYCPWGTEVVRRVR